MVGKKIKKTFFDFLSPRLGTNVSLFCLSEFRKVGALTHPISGLKLVQGERGHFFTPSGKKTGGCRTNTLGVMNF